MNIDQNETTALQTMTTSASDERSTAGALMLDVRTMESLMKVANLMADGKTTVPKHLQGNPADCMAVVMQSMQWGMNPFAVAQKTHIVSGALGYEAQLVNAVVQQSRAITGRFHYEYQGATGAVECRVGAQIKGDDFITWGEWLNEKTVATKNSPLWKTNVKQQLGYLQVKNWARLYCPGAILGVYSEDELEALPPRDMGAVEVVTPVITPELAEAAKKSAAGGKKAFATWFKSISEEDRNKLAPMRPELEEIWVKADASRTMENPVSDKPKEPAPAKQDAPVVTFDSVMQKLTSAQNLDALYVAADWIGEVSDPAQRAQLTAKFDELVPGFGG